MGFTESVFRKEQCFTSAIMIAGLCRTSLATRCNNDKISLELKVTQAFDAPMVDNCFALNAEERRNDVVG